MTTEAEAPPAAPEQVTSAEPEATNGGAPAVSPTPAPPAQVVVQKAAEDEDEGVLDLTALAPNRRLVKLPTEEHPEGEAFEIRLLDDFGIADQQKLLKWSRTYDKIFNSDEDLSDEEQAAADTRLKFVLDSVFDKVLDAPKAVKAKMSDGIRSRVMIAFSLAPLIAQNEKAQREAKQKEKEAQEAESQTSETSTSES